MPIFGLVWVASWVGCFFPSSQDLLQAPSHPACVLPSACNSSSSRMKGCSTAPNTLALAASRPLQGSNPVSPVSSDVGAGTSFSISSLLNLFSPTPATMTQTGWQPTSSRSTVLAVKPSSENLLKAFKNLLQMPILSTRANSVSVAQIKADPATVAIDGAASRAVGFGRCLMQPDADAAPFQKPERFQVKFKGFVIGEFPDRQQATRVAQRLERFLNNPQLATAQIEAALVKGMPAVKWGDRILVTLNQDLIRRLTCNPELLTIRWVNNLRTALEQPTLSISEAQAAMYGLQTTDQTIQGLASWYGPYFNGRQTATGETFDENDFTAAHRSLPFDTYLKVTNLLNGKSVIVRINDRGPYFDNRSLDLSKEAARSIESEETGVIPIEAVIMKSAADPKSGAKVATKNVADL